MVVVFLDPGVTFRKLHLFLPSLNKKATLKTLKKKKGK